MFERHSVKDFDTFKLIFDFANSLQLYNEITWSDKYGITLVSIGRNLVPKLIQEWNIDSLSYAVILSPLIKGQVPSPPFRILLPIGSSLWGVCIRYISLSINSINSFSKKNV